jgi:nucleotide-binding universal stress UspA family protein
VPVAILSVLGVLPALETEPGRIEDRTGPQAAALRHRIAERVAEAVDGYRTIPIYVVHGLLGTTVASVAELWSASLIVVGLGRPGMIGRPRHRRVQEIVRHVRRNVLAVSPTTGNALGRAILTADFGGTGTDANELALSLLTPDATAELVHVAPVSYVSESEQPRWMRIYQSAVNELFEVTEDALVHGADRVIPTRVLKGDASEELIGLARRERVDLIALGRHATRGGRPSSLDPVVDAVIDAAPCSVLIAPSGQHLTE